MNVYASMCSNPVCCDDCVALIVMLGLGDVKWFKPVKKRLNRQSGSQAADLLKEIPFLSHMNRSKLSLLGELFTFIRFAQGSECVTQVMILLILYCIVLPLTATATLH